jgi:hypothetical protein
MIWPVTSGFGRSINDCSWTAVCASDPGGIEVLILQRASPFSCAQGPALAVAPKKQPSTSAPRSAIARRDMSLARGSEGILTSLAGLVNRDA